MKVFLLAVIAVCLAGFAHAATGPGDGCTDTCDAGLSCVDVSGTKTCRYNVDTTCAVANKKCVPGTTGFDTCTLNAKCACKEGFTAASDNSKCTGNPGATCDTAKQDTCLNGACTSSKCVCTAATHVPNAGSTKCVLQVGQVCVNTADCLDNGDCTGSPLKCACQSGYKVISGGKTKCLKIVKIDESCVAGTNFCPEPNAACTSGTCKCSTNYLPLADKTGCRKAPGQSCTKAEECGANAECSKDGKCACKSGYSTNSDNSKICSGAPAIVGSTLMFLLAALFVSRLN